jgi:hypothetical protein
MKIALMCVVVLAVLLSAGLVARAYNLGGFYAVVEDNVAAARYPSIRNDRAFGVISVDGGNVHREMMIPFRDMYPGILVKPGAHQFEVSVTALGYPATYSPYAASFTGVVLAGHRYIIASSKGDPILVETR